MTEPKVSLKIQFLFNPDATWSRISEFEADLAEFLASKGKEAIKLRTLGTTEGEIIIEVKQQDKLDKAREGKEFTKLPDTKELEKKAKGKDGRK